MSFKFVPHTADIKIVAEAKTLERAFVESAMALKEAMAGKRKIRPKAKKEIKVNGMDKESLLYNFIEEFLYLFDAKDFILSKVQNLKIKRGKKSELTAEVLGDKASPYKFTNDVKAVTYNDMLVKETKGKTTIHFVLDV